MTEALALGFFGGLVCFFLLQDRLFRSFDALGYILELLADGQQGIGEGKLVEHVTFYFGFSFFCVRAVWQSVV